MNTTTASDWVKRLLHWGLRLSLLGYLGALSAGAAGPRFLQGHVPRAATTLVPLGRLDPTHRLNLALGLPLHNQAALTNLLRELYDPASPRFHQFVTPQQFTALFGPTAQEYQDLMDFALAHGFRVTRTFPNRAVLDVEAAVSNIESTFHVTLQTYQHPAEARTFYAPNTEPSVDSAVPIVDISGLNDYQPPRPLFHKLENPLSSQPRPAFGSGPGGTYRGNDFRAAYAPGVAANGFGQTVGLLEFDGYNTSDITNYEAQSGLPNVPLTNVLLDSFNGSAGGANIEVALDIEVAIAMAPGLSGVIVYEAGPSGFPNDILSRMVSDNIAKQLSSSWTWSGGPNSTTDSLFQQMAAQGQSFFQAAGDDNAYTSAIPQPADSPYITVVGGTTLTTSGSGGAWSSERTWNWYNTGGGTNGTGGGVSTSYTIPTWQQTLSMSGNQGSTTMRNIPDVALTADNVWVTYNNGSSGAVGGTSCAAPLWAGFMALINQQAVGNGNSPIGFLNPSLYSLGTGANYSSAFHDITTGNNTNNSSPTKFFAATGYDLCTGWGTPAGSNLISALAGPATAQISSNSLALAAESCSNNAVDPGEAVTLNFGLINSGSANTANLVATLQAGGGVTSPSAAQTYGALVAGGSAVARPFSFTASGSCGGVITATLQLQDGASNLGTVSFTIRLGAVVPATIFAENFDGVSAPALPAGWATAVISGIQSAWVSSTSADDTPPNSAFVPDVGSASQSELTSPVIAISSSSAQLTFRQNYNLAAHTNSHPRSTSFYDGGVLQISIGSGPFTDILTAGGSFVTGGYNCTLATGTGNPMAGAQAWGGSSTGWITTTVSLPASAAGQNIQLKWVCATGLNSSTGSGWFVDSISLLDSLYQCCTPDADVGVSQTAAPKPGAVGQNLIYTLKIQNAGPSPASSVTLTDALPSNVTFVSASPGCINLGGTIACLIGTMAAGASSNIVLTVQPQAEETSTNLATIATTTPDPNSTNDVSLLSVAVYVPPSFTTQPTNQITNVGGSASFYVAATGSAPLSYQWTFNGANLASATTSSLNLANVQPSQAGNYAAVVSNPSGSVTSTVATLTVLVPPSISAQPTNQIASLNANASFQTVASGTAPLAYQWLFNGSALASATASVLSLTSVQTNQAGGYSVVITNAAGSVTSAVASLTVLVPPAITQEPASQTVVQGSNATFQAAATGSNPLAYQWFFNNSALPGATLATLGLTNVQPNQAGDYELVVTNGAGATTGTVAQLTVWVPPSISTQPTNRTVAVGSNPGFVVTALGTAPLAYQWWFNGTNQIGNDTNYLTLSNVQTGQSGAYSVTVTNSAGSVTSAVAMLAVGTPPTILQQPTGQNVVQGQNATLNVSAGGTDPLSYQWRLNGTPLSSATTSSLAVTWATPANAGAYDAIVNNPYGSITSAVAQLVVLVPPTITAQPTNQTVVAGSGVSFQVGASGTAPLSYQWWFNNTNTLGANTNVLSVSDAQPSQAGTYTVTVTNSAGALTSAVAVLTIVTTPAITQQPASLLVVQGQNATFNVGATGSAPLTYEWRLNGAPVATGTSSSYTVIAAANTNAGNYDAVVSNAYGSTTSVVAQLTVMSPPTISTQPTNQDAAVGSGVVFQVVASGAQPLSYQWWFNGTNAVGANTNTLSLSSVQTNQAGGYFVVVANSAGSITSAVATLTVGVPPAIAGQPVSLSVAQGQNATFSVAAVGTAPMGYQWRFNGAQLASATNNSYTVVNATTASGGSYEAIVSNAYGSVTSAVAQLTVLVPPTIVSQPTNQTLLAGSSVNFQVAVTGSAPLSYQWWFNGTNAVGANTNMLSFSSVQAGQAGDYLVVVTNSAGSATSAVAVLTVGVAPSIGGQPVGLSVVQGQNATFSVAAAGTAPLGYQWRLNGAQLASATTSSYTVVGATTSNAGAYDAIVSNAYGAITSVVAQLTVLVPPTITNQPAAQTVALGKTAVFQVSVSGTTPIAYQWWFDQTNAVGSDTNVLTLPNVQASQAGAYRLVATNAAGAVTSTLATLTVLLPPTVTMQPSNQVIAVGGTAGFTAAASGSSPLSYQWVLNGTPLAGASNAALWLTNVQPAQAGSYSLVVTNAAGSASSSSANLTVLVAPTLTAPSAAGPGFSVQVPSVAGLSYSLEYKNLLQDASWTETTQWVPGTGGILVLQDTNTVTSSRFYRVRCQ